MTVKDSDLTPEQKLEKSRAQLLLDQPFFGNLLLSLKMVERNDLTHKSMGVDGEHIFWDKSFVDDRNIAQIKGVLIHEVMHVALAHLSRKKNYHDHLKWNYACDYSINQIIRKMSSVDISDGIYDPQYENMSAEQIYKLLPQNEQLEDQTEGKFVDDHGDCDDVQQQKIVKRMVNVYDNLSEAERQKGKLPAEIERLIRQLKKPQFDWRKYIKATVETIFLRTDYNSSRKSFLFQDICGEDSFFPKLQGFENSVLAVVVDTSGSITSDQLQDFATEISAVSQLADKTIVLTCDAAVHEEVTLDKFDDVFNNLKFRGGGGTNFKPAFEHLQKKRIRPECLVFLTDGYGTFPDCAPNYPVIWCLTPSHLETSAFPFGEFIELTDLGKDND